MRRPEADHFSDFVEKRGSNFEGLLRNHEPSSNFLREFSRPSKAKWVSTFAFFCFFPEVGITSATTRSRIIIIPLLCKFQAKQSEAEAKHSKGNNANQSKQRKATGSKAKQSKGKQAHSEAKGNRAKQIIIAGSKGQQKGSNANGGSIFSARLWLWKYPIL